MMDSPTATPIDEAAPNAGPDGGVERMLFFMGAPLFPKAMTPPLLTFCRLHRAARNIADDPAIAAERKVALLDRAITALAGGSPAPFSMPAPDQSFSAMLHDFVQASHAVGADPRHAGHVLQAIRQDATKTRYRDWGEFFAYCRYAAAPVARYALEACGERAAEAQPGAEALCCAWRILAMLQNAPADYRLRNRVYLPARWFKDHGAVVEDLGREATTPALRAVLAEGAQAAVRLLDTAQSLPGAVRQRRLRGALAANLYLARRFVQRFATAEPFAASCQIGKIDRAIAITYGLARRWA